MKKKTDDLINKYIDNELDSAELTEFTELIGDDEETVKNLKAMKIVDQSLRKIEFENSPSDITYKVMLKIASAKKAKRSNLFFWFVISVFLIGIATATFYTIQNYQPGTDSIKTEKAVDTVKNFIGDKTKSFDSILKGIDIKLIGTILTLLFAVTGYFIVETHRSFKNKLKSL